MLDAQKESSSHSLSFSVYQKPTHTDLYLQFDSDQPLQHKLGVILTLYLCCDTICSSEQAKLQETDRLKGALSVSSYTKSACVTTRRPKPLTGPQVPSTTKVKGSITLPYMGHVTDAVACTIHIATVTVHVRPFNTTRSHVVNPKDKILKEERSRVVYNIQWSDCDATYIGDTERSLRKRVLEHHRTSSPMANTSKDTDIPSLNKMSPYYAKCRTGSARGWLVIHIARG